MSNEFKLVPVEPTVEIIAALGFSGDVDLAIGHGAISEEIAKNYAAALAAAPQPPALGGEPEVLGYLVSGFSTQFSKVAGGFDEQSIALIDRAHLAPLQADIAERWEHISELNSSIVELRAERDQLKARCDELEAALSGLVTINEQHNAAVAKIIETPLGWKDDYLDIARAALSKPAGSEKDGAPC